MMTDHRVSRPWTWRERVTFAIAGWLGTWIVRLVMWTVRVRVDAEPGAQVHSERREPAVYVFWHDQLLLGCYTHRGRGITVLISRHRDGEYIDRVARKLGYRTVRGSTTRGGASSLKELVQELQAGHDVGLTPDGPRGPRHVLQAGGLYLAERSGRPIVPLAAAVRSCWRLSSWDRFIIPKPFTKALVRFGRPLHIPADLTGEQREDWRRKVEQALVDLTAQVERDVAG